MLKRQRRQILPGSQLKWTGRICGLPFGERALDSARDPIETQHSSFKPGAWHQA